MVILAIERFLILRCSICCGLTLHSVFFFFVLLVSLYFCRRKGGGRGIFFCLFFSQWPLFGLIAHYQFLVYSRSHLHKHAQILCSIVFIGPATVIAFLFSYYFICVVLCVFFSFFYNIFRLFNNSGLFIF